MWSHGISAGGGRRAVSPPVLPFPLRRVLLQPPSTPPPHLPLTSSLSVSHHLSPLSLSCSLILSLLTSLPLSLLSRSISLLLSHPPLSIALSFSLSLSLISFLSLLSRSLSLLLSHPLSLSLSLGASTLCLSLVSTLMSIKRYSVYGVIAN